MASERQVAKLRRKIAREMAGRIAVRSPLGKIVVDSTVRVLSERLTDTEIAEYTSCDNSTVEVKILTLLSEVYAELQRRFATSCLTDSSMIH